MDNVGGIAYITYMNTLDQTHTEQPIRWRIYDYDTGQPASDKTYATVSGGDSGLRAAYKRAPDRRFTLQLDGWTRR